MSNVARKELYRLLIKLVPGIGEMKTGDSVRLKTSKNAPPLDVEVLQARHETVNLVQVTCHSDPKFRIVETDTKILIWLDPERRTARGSIDELGSVVHDVSDRDLAQILEDSHDAALSKWPRRMSRKGYGPE